MLLSPLQIVQRNEQSAFAGKTRVYLNFEGFTFVYIDNYRQVFLPALRVDIRSRDIQLESSSSSEFYTGLKVEVSYNNSRTARWEPVVEPCYFDIIYRAKEHENIVCVMAGSEESQEALCFNVSEELVEVLAHCSSNLKMVLQNEEFDSSSSPKSPSLLSSDGRSEEAIYDSQFLVRNQTGYDFHVQTVGDKKSKPTLIKNQQEKFVHFILDDEFSTRETIHRSMIVTFDQNIGQSKRI